MSMSTKTITPPSSRKIKSESFDGATDASNSLPSSRSSYRRPSREEMHAVFTMCRQNQWSSVLNSVRSNSSIAVTPMVMDNNIATTVLHQAITSKGDTEARARVVEEILRIRPQAAAMKNGYGSLPLHVISQRNTKIKAKIKARLIEALVHAYKGALVEEGGVGKRTPLHIIFTDYISPELTKTMIENGRKACFKKDKNGFLPAHVACSRHCSPEKLEYLLEVNPDALTAKTNDGGTLLSLAKSTATKSHPNYALIEKLESYLKVGAGSAPARAPSFTSVVSTDSYDSDRKVPATRKKRRNTYHADSYCDAVEGEVSPSNSTRAVRSKRRRTMPRGDSASAPGYKNNSPTVDDPAHLLLHFSRHNRDNEDMVKRIAYV